MAFAHPESGTAVAYICNSMLWDGITGPDERWLGWTKALRDALGIETRWPRVNSGRQTILSDDVHQASEIDRLLQHGIGL